MAGLPWPKGDPGALKDAAAKARDVAASVREAGQRLSKAASNGDEWKGQAASSFASAVAEDGRDLGKAAGSFATAATAFSKLAQVLDEAQNTVKRWARKVEEAEERARSAQERAQEAATTLENAEAAKNPFMAPLGPADPISPFTAPAESAAYQAAQRDATEAQADATTMRRKAQEEAQRAVEEVERADRETAGEIRDAAGNAPLGGSKGGGVGAATGLLPGLSGDVFGPLGQFLFGDFANFWSGTEGGFPYGSLGAGAIRILRTGLWIRAASAASAVLDPATGLLAASKFPTFNTGLVGRGLQQVGPYVPGLGRAAGWLGTPGATTFSRRAGVVGGVASTGLDAYNLYKQGNPVEAFEREGAGYVADVARTGFSASTTAFFVAPNPVTGGAVIVTGVVWAGAEVWDEWGDDIKDFGADAWDATSDFAGDAWDATSDFAGDAWDAGGDVVEGVGDVASDAWDKATFWD